MREALALLEGRRITVTATVLKQGRRVGWGEHLVPTMLLGQVCAVDGTVLTDHLWLDVGKRFAAADLRLGDAVQFSARVAPYHRTRPIGLDPAAPDRIDFNLAYPTQVTVVARVVRQGTEPAGATKKARTAQKVLAWVTQLWQQLGEPVPLTLLLDHPPIEPRGLMRVLLRLVHAGIVVLQPNGTVFVRADNTVGRVP